MSVNLEFEINAKEVFAALRDSGRLPDAIDDRGVTGDAGIEFRIYTDTYPDGLDVDTLQLLVVLP